MVQELTATDLLKDEVESIRLLKVFNQLDDVLVSLKSKRQSSKRDIFSIEGQTFKLNSMKKGKMRQVTGKSAHFLHFKNINQKAS
jgi:hypothetical protein